MRRIVRSVSNCFIVLSQRHAAFLLSTLLAPRHGSRCQALADGRFHLEVEGRRRFGISKSWEQDGYRVAQVNWIEDVPLEECSSEKEQLNALLKSASSLAKTWLQHGHDLSRSDRRAVLDMVKRAESMPDSTKAESFSFWIANLIRTRPDDRLQLLRTTDTRERLNREMQLLRDAQGCYVQ